MRSDQLTRAQAHALKNKISQQLDYLTRLRRRMAERGFPEGDPLLESAKRAEMALHDLQVKCHYLSAGVSIDRQLTEPPRFEGIASNK